MKTHAAWSGAWAAVLLLNFAKVWPASAAESFADLRAKAEAGDSSAQYSLGLMYDQGNGVPKNSIEAVKWYRKAAEQGLAAAQRNLGLMYLRGEGVPPDVIQAHAWLNIAGALGDKTAQEQLPKVEVDMTVEQHEEAVRLAQELFAKMQK